MELLRNKSNQKEFWDWGLPTSYCIKEIYPLKKKYNFTLIGSGGINSSDDIAKAFALGTDLIASARIILQTLMNDGEDAVIKLIVNWFEYLKKVMYLTGSQNIDQLKNDKLIKKEFLF